MTLYLDSSAAFSVATQGRSSELFLSALNSDDTWCTSVITPIETLALSVRVSASSEVIALMDASIQQLLDRTFLVPVDRECIQLAKTHLREGFQKLSNAIHLSSAERLPRPVHFLTLDPGQISTALDLGFSVVSDFEL